MPTRWTINGINEPKVDLPQDEAKAKNQEAVFQDWQNTRSSSQMQAGIAQGSQPNENAISHKRKGFTVSKLISLFLIVFSLLILTGGGYFAYTFASTVDNVVVNDDCEGPFCILGDTPNIFKPQPLKGEDTGRTNFLVMGVDVEANLADTIILVSYYHKENKLVTLNIPRDLYARMTYTTDSGRTKSLNNKINSLYPFADRDSENEGAGAEATAAFISKEFQIPIHYWVVTNFQAVEDIIDELDGVNVDVDKAFTDCAYPAPGYRGYIRPCPEFTVGTERMDGTRALIYARSRKAAGDAGDFARSRRQSLVIKAILKELTNQGISNVNNITAYLRILGKNIRTNMELGEMYSFYTKFSSIENIDESYYRVIWDDGGPELCAGAVADIGYHIIYCGGGIPGSGSSSVGKVRALDSVQNLLNKGIGEEIFDSSMIFLGNQSNETARVRKAFIDTGFTNTAIDNSYTNQIKAATATSVEKATVYFRDEATYNLFQSLPEKPAGEYQTVLGLPEDKIVPARNANTEIIVWVETIIN